MEDESDLWNVLTDLGDDYIAPPARPDASIVLLSLPIELLQEIAHYCKFSDVHSLATVCRPLHAVAIYRLYTTVALHAGKFIPNTLQPTLDNGEQTTDDFLRLCALSDPNCGGILCGLLARQEHLNALRTLIICDVPLPPSSAYRHHANVVVRDIISRAQGLQHIIIPSPLHDRIYSTDASAGKYEQPLELKDYQWPTSLRSLRTDFLPDDDMNLRPLLAQITNLVIQYTIVIAGNAPLYMGLEWNLRHLDCLWAFIHADGTTNPLGSICNFIIALSKLETLAVGLEERRYENWSQITDFMSPTILDAYISIAGKLKHLRELKIYNFTEEEEEYINPKFKIEQSTILRLAKASQHLERVTLQVRYLYGFKRPNVTWKRCAHPEAEEEAIWLPDPAVFERWKIWLKEYTTPELVERRMHQFWGKERVIPSLLDLQNFAC